MSDKAARNNYGTDLTATRSGILLLPCVIHEACDDASEAAKPQKPYL